MSLNAAEGKERMGLKDLAKLVSDQTKEEGSKDTAKATEGNNTTSKPAKESRKNKRDKRREEKRAKKVLKAVEKENKKNKKDNKATDASLQSSPVSKDKPAPIIKPAIEQQDKPAESIATTDKPIDLTQPIRDPKGFVGQDNSMDGFLSIKH